MRRMMIGACLFLAACAPVTKMIPDGNGWIQKTDERNIWWANTISQRRCVELEKGFCKEDGRQPVPLLTTAEAAGPKLVGAVLTTAGFLGGAGLLMHGLQTQNVPPASQQNILGGSSISTLNLCGAGPAFVGMAPAPGCR